VLLGSHIWKILQFMFIFICSLVYDTLVIKGANNKCWAHTFFNFFNGDFSVQQHHSAAEYRHKWFVG
jgi:hypothetical protein